MPPLATVVRNASASIGLARKSAAPWAMASITAPGAALRRYQHDRGFRKFAGNHGENFESAGVRHLDIGHHQVKWLGPDPFTR